MNENNENQVKELSQEEMENMAGGLLAHRLGQNSFDGDSDVDQADYFGGAPANGQPK